MCIDHPRSFGEGVRSRPRAAPAFSAQEIHLRTNVYIDGFNFYYGAVKGTPYRWLDFAQFCAVLPAPGYDSPNQVLHGPGEASAP